MTERPTVVRVITWLPLGGIERRLAAVVPRLARMGWPVRVLCIREEGPLAEELRRNGVPVDVIPLRSRLSPPGIAAMNSYFRRHRVGIVHAHMYRANTPATIAARLAGVRAVYGHIHNIDSWDNRRQILVDRVISRLRRGTFAVSRAVQRDVMEKLRLPESKVPLLYNGIDLEEFLPDPAAGDALRAELALDDNTVLFLVPARLHRQKNPLGVLRAFARLTQSGQIDSGLAFAGGGGLLEDLKHEAANLGIDERVHFLGPRSDMRALYSAADAVVLSSFREGFSNAVVEALACGTPVIASDVGGNREAISQPQYGWIHPPGDEDALVHQMKEALQAGRTALRAMSTDCRNRAQHFSLETLVANTHRLYCDALGTKP